MRHRFERLLDDPRSVYLASATSLALGLFFVFVWAPHPWGWKGIDQYHELARALARGEPFPTMKVPWGYSYFVAAFYVVFGERAWVPVTFQVIVNAAVPVMLHRLIRPAVGQRTATLAALLAGLLSFNTVYASTQASDAICTVLFTASLWCFAVAYRTSAAGYFALSGILMGLVPQFRPNMLLFPLVISAWYLLTKPRTRRTVGHVALLLGVVAIAQAPWVIRNYRLTGEFLPTSTHGGTQLWYGSLQVGPYLESQAHNPRSLFVTPAFDYTSLAHRSILISAHHSVCLPRDGERVELVYWTNHDRTPTRVAARLAANDLMWFEVPGQPLGTTLRYYVESSWPAAAAGPAERFVTPGGAANPFVFFISDDHLGDLDRDDELLDVFDVGRMLAHVAWNEPLPRSDLVDADRNGRVDEVDVAAAAAALLPGVKPAAPGGAIARVIVADAVVVLQLVDGSTLARPRAFSGRHSDFVAIGELAELLIARRRTFSDLTIAAGPPTGCRPADDLLVNNVFYRAEPAVQHRHFALAWDNIRRDPAAFLAAAAYRMVRLFIIRGTDDRATTQQFQGDGLIYGAGLALSTAYFLTFLSGAIIAWRQRSPLLVALLPITYVPLTIAFVLTNMRYTVTVQPLMFAFVAVALGAALRLDSPGGERKSA